MGYWDGIRFGSNEQVTMIKQIDFIAIPVQDMARARAFYEDTLELQPSGVWADQFVEYEIGGTTLALGRVEAMGMAFAPVTTGMVALGVDDFDAALARLKAKGVALPEQATDSGVCHMAMFSDSEGNALVLHRRYAPEQA